MVLLWLLQKFLMNLGNYKHGSRRGLRDADGPSVGEGKPVRRGGTSAYNSLEVWFLFKVLFCTYLCFYYVHLLMCLHGL